MNLVDRFLYSIIRPIAPQWFADRYRRTHAEQLSRLEEITRVISKIGVLSLGPRRRGYGEFLETIRVAGRRLGAVVCYDDFGAAYEAKQVWPDVLTVGMFTDTDYGFNYDTFKRKAQLNPWINYWAVYNEIGGQSWSEYARQADDYIRLMPRMRDDGLRLGMFSCASGTPPTPDEDGGACYAEIARACKYAVDNHHDALLLLHEYQSIGTIGRYRYLRDYLIERGAMLPTVISEFGFETFPGTAPFMAMVKQNDPVYMPDGWIEGCGTWALGNNGWAKSNYEAALPQLGEYIAEVEPVGIEYIVLDNVLVDGEPIGAQINFSVAFMSNHNIVPATHRGRGIPIPPDSTLQPVIIHESEDAATAEKIAYHTLTTSVTPEENAPYVHIEPSGGTFPHGALVEFTITIDELP